MGRLLTRGVVAVALVGGGVVGLSQAAWAHVGSAIVTCTGVTFSFEFFPNVPGNAVNETVLVDGSQVAAQAFSFDGSTGNNVITISVGMGAHTVEADGNWTADGSGSMHVVQMLFDCQAPSDPAGGSFVIGDVTAGGPTIGPPVNFWGAQWWKNNAMREGSGPPACKGFENSDPTPTCGDTWTATPGNSAGEPATIPGLMYVIVTSDPHRVRVRHHHAGHDVVMHGSVIQGNAVHIVVVQTNPGYANDPGHAGTGTIVGVVC